MLQDKMFVGHQQAKNVTSTVSELFKFVPGEVRLCTVILLLFSGHCPQCSEFLFHDFDSVFIPIVLC